MNDTPDIRPIGLLKFSPIYRTVRWGGTRLASFKGLERLPSDRVGESWEISGLRNEETVVENGPLKGYTLSRLLGEFGRRLMGARLFDKFGNFFPLLVKFIDAEDDLSIQVHPGDSNAPDGHGKTELWYIIKSEPGSYIYSGFNRPLDRDRLKSAMSSQQLVDVLAKHFPAAGDVFYIPAGQIHSIGAGNLILEIQQTSGITYRLHDYDRKDRDGKKRQLHVDEAFDVIDYRQTDFGLARPQMLIGCETLVKRTEYFSVSAIQVMDRSRINVSEYDSPRILIAIAGAGVIKDSFGNEIALRQGESLLVPAETEYVDIRATSTPLKIITVFIE